MEIFRTKPAVRGAVGRWKKAGESVGLVPTMGYLHEGHLALVRAARAENDRVIVSIFVNPTQFAPGEDYAVYPRDEARDLALLAAEGVDGVFIPSVEEMYPAGPSAVETAVDPGRLGRILIGRLRPGHFRGVATVVSKLFNIVQPDRAYFGEKDYQQLAVIRQMVRDLDMPVEIRGVPIVREEDGLAMSSRNVRLSPEDRAAAVVLSRALDAAEARMAEGPVTAPALAQLVEETIRAEPRAEIRSIDVRDAETLAPVRGFIRHPAVVLLAARFGEVFLIDNRVLTPPAAATAAPRPAKGPRR